MLKSKKKDPSTNRKITTLFFVYNIYTLMLIMLVILLVNDYDITGNVNLSVIGLIILIIIFHAGVYKKLRIGLMLEYQKDRLYDQLKIPKGKHE